MQDELDFEFHLPAGREKFRTWEVARVIGHSEKHVISLIEAGEFPNAVDGRHPKAAKTSWVVPRADLVAWLKKRKR